MAINVNSKLSKYCYHYLRLSLIAFLLFTKSLRDALPLWRFNTSTYLKTLSAFPDINITCLITISLKILALIIRKK